jgi:hypothetical protein
MMLMMCGSILMRVPGSESMKPESLCIAPPAMLVPRQIRRMAYRVRFYQEHPAHGKGTSRWKAPVSADTA